MTEQTVLPTDGAGVNGREVSGRGVSGREVELLRLLAEGRSTAQIAALFVVSSNTARTKIRRVQGKLDVSDRGAAVRAARNLGLLPEPRPPEARAAARRTAS
jgi:ATP/maltotriose-dependent transcriptional regulator MalT